MHALGDIDNFLLFPFDIVRILSFLIVSLGLCFVLSLSTSFLFRYVSKMKSKKGSNFMVSRSEQSFVIR